MHKKNQAAVELVKENQVGTWNLLTIALSSLLYYQGSQGPPYERYLFMGSGIHLALVSHGHQQNHQ